MHACNSSTFVAYEHLLRGSSELFIQSLVEIFWSEEEEKVLFPALLCWPCEILCHCAILHATVKASKPSEGTTEWI